jgi:SAM-dependent methyltransferase
MTNWHNESGRPLSAVAWLEAHHSAKIVERTEFTKRVICKSPKRIVDLGCGPGIWLELFSQHADTDCELFGIDADEGSIAHAMNRSRSWEQDTRFQCINIDTNPEKIPESDIYLAFNIFPYIKNISLLMETLRKKLRPGGFLVIRQYDGSLLRIGPMNTKDRSLIDTSLQTSIVGSTQFMHYDLDRVFEAVSNSFFEDKLIEFEVFKRVAPYPDDFLKYFTNTIDWTLDHISEDAGKKLLNWYTKIKQNKFHTPSYFSEVDLVAWLS